MDGWSEHFKAMHVPTEKYRSKTTYSQGVLREPSHWILSIVTGLPY